MWRADDVSYILPFRIPIYTEFNLAWMRMVNFTELITSFDFDIPIPIKKFFLQGILC